MHVRLYLANRYIEHDKMYGYSLESVGEIIGMTRERVRQIEENVLEKVHKNIKATGKESEFKSYLYGEKKGYFHWH